MYLSTMGEVGWNYDEQNRRQVAYVPASGSRILRTGLPALAARFRAARGHGPGLYGSVATRVLFGVVLPTFTRMGSRSFALPVYFTTPSMFTSSRQ